MISGVYRITAPSGRAYVGSSQSIALRWRTHRYQLRKGTHHCKALQAAHEKYGLSALNFEILETCEPADLLAREQQYLTATPRQRLYNSTLTAGSLRGYKASVHTKALIAARLTGLIRGPDTRAAMSTYASARSAVHLAKLAAAGRGKVVSAATREKQAAAKRGRKQSPALIAKRVAAQSGAIRVDNRSGFPGVSQDGNRWVARIKLEGRYKNLGRFDTPSQAAAALLAFKRDIVPSPLSSTGYPNMAALNIAKSIALAVLHATVLELHERFANDLNRGGVPASSDEHADDLVAKSCAAGTASPTCAPNFADAARASFQNGMAAAMTAFAAEHLPEKFQPAASVALQGIRAALEGDSTDDLVDDAVAAGVAATAAINPVAGAVASMAAPVIEELTHEAMAKRGSK